MATIPCFHPISHNSITTQKLAGSSCGINSRSQNILRGEKLCFFKLKASNNDPSPKKSALLCADCDGNGAVLCSQCKGAGVNSIDHFNGQFKAGDSCWLCGGKKDVLCGNCQGAGFLGGFMTSSDT